MYATRTIMIVTLMCYSMWVGYTQNLDARERTEPPTEESVENSTNNQKQRINQHTKTRNHMPIVGITLGIGVLTEISGLLFAVETNRLFNEASNTKVEISSANEDTKSDLESKYNTQYQNYQQNFLISGILLGAGTLTLGTGIYLSIHYLLARKKNAPFNTKTEISYTSLPLFESRSSKSYLLITPRQIGVTINL